MYINTQHTYKHTHIHTHIHTHTHTHTHTCNNETKRGHEFERDQSGIDGRGWREERVYDDM